MKCNLEENKQRICDQNGQIVKIYYVLYLRLFLLFVVLKPHSFLVFFSFLKHEKKNKIFKNKL